MERSLHERIAPLSVPPGTTLMTALQRMHHNDAKLLLVMQGSHFVSVLSIGDIQRAIIRNLPLDSPVSAAIRPTVRVANSSEPLAAIHQRMLEHRIELMPVLDSRGDLAEVIFWKDVLPASSRRTSAPLDVPVVVMAGGRGLRLRPLTNIIPKPLLPLRDRPVIEEIMDRFHASGVQTFHISVNYKAEMIQAYLEAQGKPYQLNFVRENQPLGTAGSLRLLRPVLHSTFFVSNCDILVDHDYAEMLRHHREEGSEITAVAAVAVHSMPYGIFECDESGKLLRLREKPDLTMLVNVGLYIVEPHLLEDIPEDRSMDITELMDSVRARGGRVGLFPISERAWADIGEWQKYYQAVTHPERLQPPNCDDSL